MVTALPDVAAALPWRDWETGSAEARQRRVPILAFAEAPWTNGAQRWGLILSQDAALGERLAEQTVPVLLDPFARPDLVSQWRTASVALAGTIGPPLVMFLTHEGRPFLSYCTMWPEGRDPYPSLAALAQAAGEAYARDSDAFVAEAATLEAASGSSRPAFRSPREWLRGLLAQTDPRYGGLRETPKHPHPQLLWFLLDLHESNTAPEAGQFVKTTLCAMLRGGINDQAAVGFHRCARDERWIVPHFEKPAPLNAQLASVYARAARGFDDRGFLMAADLLVGFCVDLLQAGVDAVASDSQYYTWTSRELLDALPPVLVQAVSLHYNTTPDGSRQVLYRARDLETLQEYINEAPEPLHQRLEDGRRALREARSRRQAPALVPRATLSWPAQTIRWLFEAAAHGSTVSVCHLAAHLDRLTAAPLDVGHGYRRDGCGHEGQAWLEDQAAVLAAMVAAFAATREERWLVQARLLADVVLDRYTYAGGWLDRPRELGATELSQAHAAIDDVLPSTIATLTESLSLLGDALAEPRYAHAARQHAAAHLNVADPAQWSAGLWRAWFRVA